MDFRTFFPQVVRFVQAQRPQSDGGIAASGSTYKK